MGLTGYYKFVYRPIKERCFGWVIEAMRSQTGDNPNFHLGYGLRTGCGFNLRQWTIAFYNHTSGQRGYLMPIYEKALLAIVLLVQKW